LEQISVTFDVYIKLFVRNIWWLIIFLFLNKIKIDE